MMFDFLREIKDNVAAEIALIGFDSAVSSEKKTPLIILDESGDGKYLKAMGYGYASVYCNMMKIIVDKNLQYSDSKTIEKELNRPLFTSERIEEILEAYSKMYFFKRKGYSADEAGIVMQVLNAYADNKNKELAEISKLANCTVEDVIAVVKLLDEYEKWTRQQQMLYAITKHKDFGKRNPVDIGIECGYSEKEVIELIRSLEQEAKENE